MPPLWCWTSPPDFQRRGRARSPAAAVGPAGCLCRRGAPAGHGCVRPDGVCQNARGCGRTQPSDHPEPERLRCAGWQGRREAGSAAVHQAVSGRHCRRAGRSTARRRHPADWLFKDSRRGRVFPVSRPRKGVREAVLEYRIVKTAGEMSLAEITLHTGRTHQIRVQFASRKHPLTGDGKYGSRVKGSIALQSCGLQFLHPETGKPMHLRCRCRRVRSGNRLKNNAFPLGERYGTIQN